MASIQTYVWRLSDMLRRSNRIQQTVHITSSRMRESDSETDPPSPLAQYIPARYARRLSSSHRSSSPSTSFYSLGEPNHFGHPTHSNHNKDPNHQASSSSGSTAKVEPFHAYNQESGGTGLRVHFSQHQWSNFQEVDGVQIKMGGIFAGDELRSLRRGTIYVVEKLLGKGAFGAVLEAKDKVTGKQWAVKVFTGLPNAKALRGEHKEHVALKPLQDALSKHRDHVGVNDVAILDDWNDEVAPYYLVFDFCEGGDLENLIRQHRQGLPLNNIQEFMEEILSGLKYVHDSGLVHRDLKPENILLKGGRAMIADFGLAAHVGAQNSGIAGTPVYMAPELLRAKVNGKSKDATAAGGIATSYPLDMWGLGCILSEMITGKRLFHGGHDAEILSNIEKYCNVRAEERHAKYYHNKDLQLLVAVDWLLQFEPGRRPTVDQALARYYPNALHHSHPQPTGPTPAPVAPGRPPRGVPRRGAGGIHFMHPRAHPHPHRPIPVAAQAELGHTFEPKHRGSRRVAVLKSRFAKRA